MIRLIAFDLDGTALNDEKKMTEVTRKSLVAAAKRGITLLPATGRHFEGVPEVVRELPGAPYILTTNGGGIYRTENGQCEYGVSMSLPEFLDMMKQLETLDVMADAFVDGKAYMNRHKRHMIEQMDINNAVKEYLYQSRHLVDDQIEFLRQGQHNIEKLTINFINLPNGERKHYEEAWDIVRQYPCFHAVSGGMKNIEVTAQGISKASGLAYIGKKLGIRPEEMMAFGDSGNDEQMLQYVGFGVAMANGEAMVKEAADYITDSNNADGIASCLQKMKERIQNG